MAARAVAQAPGTSDAYPAYRSVRDDEPSELVDLLYGQLLPLALGIQMAGPNLTPETFETGMFYYPAKRGLRARGTEPQHYTPVVDIPRDLVGPRPAPRR